MKPVTAIGCGLLLSVSGSVFLSAAPQAVTYIRYAEAHAIMAELAPRVIPADLRALTPVERGAMWDEWVARRDREIRERLARGDRDTVLLWMALGRTFTRQMTLLQLLNSRAADSTRIAQWVQARARDFVAALASPSSTGERIEFARQVVAAAGVRTDSDEARRRAETWLVESFFVLLREQFGYAGELRLSTDAADPAEAVVRQSTLFAGRGLSLDTSWPPGLAIEAALAALAKSNVFGDASFRRVAVIGPGLDFSDKDSGFDFYPIQTVQPFALIESLARLRLADIATVSVTTLDLSPRVNRHLTDARAASASGGAYVLQLPLDGRGWHAPARQYWQQFGSLIGRPAPAAASPADVTVRAVAIAPKIVNAVTPIDLNIVVQRAALEPFDLVVATNVFVYYELFDQALALANVAAMLRPGGILLTNTPLLDLKSLSMPAIGQTTTQYSVWRHHGDQILWYQRLPSSR